MPQLQFEIDRSIKKQAEVLDAIRRAVGDEGAAGGGEGEERGDAGGGEAHGGAPRPDAEAVEHRQQPGSPSDPTNPAPEDRSP